MYIEEGIRLEELEKATKEYSLESREEPKLVFIKDGQIYQIVNREAEKDAEGETEVKEMRQKDRKSEASQAISTQSTNIASFT